MSVVISRECTGGLDTLLRGHESFGVFSFSAGEARQLGCRVVRAPDPDLPGHALVLGRKGRRGWVNLARARPMIREPVDRTGLETRGTE